MARTKRVLRALRTAFVVLVLLAGAAAGGTYIVRERQAARAFVSLGTVVLAADAVLIGSAEAGVVTEVLVREQDRIGAGQPLARVRLTAAPSGEPRGQTLTAPTAATVSAVNVAAGGVAKPGEPVLTLYDQRKLSFHAQVPIDALRQLRLGMTAAVTGPGLAQPVTATLDHVVPRVAVDPGATEDRLTVVLIPAAADIGTVSSLVPGLRFTATVDTRTATGATPAVNSAR